MIAAGQADRADDPAVAQQRQAALGRQRAACLGEHALELDAGHHVEQAGGDRDRGERRPRRSNG